MQDSELSLMRIIEQLQHYGLATLTHDRLKFSSVEAKRFCSGIWLEYYCLAQIQRLSEERPDLQDYAMSVNIEREINGAILRNELDTVCLINNRLYMVECKTATLDSKESQLALYRLDSLSELLGTNELTALVSLDSFSDIIIRRANELELRIFDYGKMQLLYMWLKNQSKKWDIHTQIPTS